MYLAGKDAALFLMDGESYIEELRANQEIVRFGVIRTLAPSEVTDADVVRLKDGDLLLSPSDKQISQLLSSSVIDEAVYNFFKCSFSCDRIVSVLDDYFTGMYQGICRFNADCGVSEWDIITRENIKSFVCTPSVSLNLDPSIADIKKISAWLYSGIVRCDDVDKAANKMLASISSMEVKILSDCRKWGWSIATPYSARWYNLGLILRNTLAKNGIRFGGWLNFLDKDLYLWEMGENQPMDFDVLPTALQTKEAKNYILEAFKAGMLRFNHGRFVWTESKRLLACFASEMSRKLKLGKGDRLSWKPFEEMFRLKKGDLRQSYNDIKKTGQNPYGADVIDKIFR